MQTALPAQVNFQAVIARNQEPPARSYSNGKLRRSRRFRLRCDKHVRQLLVQRRGLLRRLDELMPQNSTIAYKAHMLYGKMMAILGVSMELTSIY